MSRLKGLERGEGNIEGRLGGEDGILGSSQRGEPLAGRACGGFDVVFDVVHRLTIPLSGVTLHRRLRRLRRRPALGRPARGRLVRGGRSRNQRRPGRTQPVSLAKPQHRFRGLRCPCRHYTLIKVDFAQGKCPCTSFPQRTHKYPGRVGERWTTESWDATIRRSGLTHRRLAVAPGWRTTEIRTASPQRGSE